MDHWVLRAYPLRVLTSTPGSCSTRCSGTERSSCSAPSTSNQFVLALREHQPLGVVLEPPGDLLHITDGGAMVTHTCTVGKFRGPYELPDAGR